VNGSIGIGIDESKKLIQEKEFPISLPKFISYVANRFHFQATQNYY